MSPAEKQRRYREKLKATTLTQLVARDLNIPAISTETQIKRARLFLLLWNSGHPYDTCLTRVNDIYPENEIRYGTPMIGCQDGDVGSSGND